MSRDLEQKRLNIFPIWRLFPNFVTILALCSGVSSFRFALNDNWEKAVLCIIIAAFLDLLDGRVARLFKATSNFGAQLDSLADFVSFGVMPPLMLYLWSLHNITIKGVAWGIVLLYVICTIIRLARFNSMLEEEDQVNVFIGIPSTAAAIIVLVPVMLQFQFELVLSPLFIGLYVVLISLLMVSRVPTPSSKNITIRKDFAYLALLFFSCVVIVIIIEPWLSIPILCLSYLIAVFINMFNRSSV